MTTSPHSTASLNAARRARMASPTTPSKGVELTGPASHRPWRVGPLQTPADYLRALSKLSRKAITGEISTSNASRLAYILRQGADLAVKVEELRQLVALKAALEQVQSQASNGFAVLPSPSNAHDHNGFALEGELLTRGDANGEGQP